MPDREPVLRQAAHVHANRALGPPDTLEAPEHGRTARDGHLWHSQKAQASLSLAHRRAAHVRTQSSVFNMLFAARFGAEWELERERQARHGSRRFYR